MRTRPLRNRGSDLLTRRDVEGITQAVEQGIKNADLTLTRTKAPRERTAGGVYLILFGALVVLFVWGWTDRPKQNVVLNTGFIDGTSLTAEGTALSPSRFRLESIVGVARLGTNLMPIDVVLPASESVCQRLAEAVGAECENRSLTITDNRVDLGIESTGQGSGSTDGQPNEGVTASITMPDMERVTLVRESSKREITVKMSGPRNHPAQGAEAKITVTLIPQSNQNVVLKKISLTLASEPMAEPQSEKITIRFLREAPSAFQEGTSAFTLIQVSESPSLKFQVIASGITISNADGTIDVGDTRVVLIEDDRLELALAKESRLMVEDDVVTIGAGGQVRASSVKRNGLELLGKKLTVEPAFGAAVAVSSAAVVGLASVMVPAVWSFLTWMFSWLLDLVTARIRKTTASGN